MPFNLNYGVQSAPAWYEDATRRLIEDAHRARQSAYRATPAIPNFLRNPLDTVNGNPELNAAFNLRRSGVAAPHYAAAKTHLDKIVSPFQGEAVTSYMSPYIAGVLHQIGDAATRKWIEDIAPRISGSFIQRGAFGSHQHQQTKERIARDLAEAVRKQQYEELHRAYGQAAQIHSSDRRAHQSAAEGHAQLGRYEQASNIADIASAQEAAGLRQHYAERGRNLEMAERLREDSLAEDRLARYASILHGVPHLGGTSQTVQYQPGPPQMNTVGQLGSLAGQLYGASMLMRRRGGSIKKSFLKPSAGQQGLGRRLSPTRPKPIGFESRSLKFPRVPPLPKIGRF